MTVEITWELVALAAVVLAGLAAMARYGRPENLRTIGQTVRRVISRNDGSGNG